MIVQRPSAEEVMKGMRYQPMNLTNTLAALKDGSELGTKTIADVERNWTAETSYDPAGWTEDNPSYGQCCVTALVLYMTMGGEIRCGKVGRESHFWNVLPDGSELDITFKQFGDNATRGPGKKRTVESLLKNKSVAARYKILLDRVCG
jgi:hypothetical protein